MNRWIVIGFAILAGVIVYQFPHQMISPGELSEGHQPQNNNCISCHQPFWGIDNNKCISCHQLENIGRDTISGDTLRSKILFHANLNGELCTACHTDHKGKSPALSARSFDHAFLDQASVKNCYNCHQPPSDQLHPLVKNDCGSCHSTANWNKLVTFNHALILADAATKCVQCHAAPTDQMHSFFASTDCGSCHKNSAWKPATFDHNEYFQLDKHHNVQCNTCHSNNDFTVYTCYGCHEHSESKMKNEHAEEGIYNISDCASCHSNAGEHGEKRMNKGKESVNKTDAKNLEKYLKKSDQSDHKSEEEDD